MIKRRILALFYLFISLSGKAQTAIAPEPAFEFLTKYVSIRDFTCSQNQEEAYFTIQSPNEKQAVIVCIKKDKGQWSAPELVPFTGKYRDLEPFLAPDGLKLYFASNRPLHDSLSQAKDYDIWYVERKSIKSSWSNPVNLGSPVNTTNDEFYPSVAANHNLYYTSDSPKAMGKDDIFFSRWNGKTYEDPKPLDTAINSEGYEFNSYIAPDEKFIIYTIYGASDGLGSGDLYISFKDQSGNWRKAVNLGTKINSEFMDYCPFFDVPTQTLYFTSKRSFNNQSFQNLQEFEDTITAYQNGQSRIYKVSLREIITQIK